MNDIKEFETTAVRATSVDLGRGGAGTSSNSQSPVVAHGEPEYVDTVPKDESKKSWRTKMRYFLTWDFWVILLLGQFLAICITGTNTLTTLLVEEGTSIPAFQTLFNYVLLNIAYSGYTIYKYGFKKYGRLLLVDGWKCKSRKISIT